MSESQFAAVKAYVDVFGTSWGVLTDRCVVVRVLCECCVVMCESCVSVCCVVLCCVSVVMCKCLLCCVSVVRVCTWCYVLVCE